MGATHHRRQFGVENAPSRRTPISNATDLGRRPEPVSHSSPRAPGAARFHWGVERTHAWFNQLRRLKIHYERRCDINFAFLHIGCALICWNFLVNSFLLGAFNSASTDLPLEKFICLFNRVWLETYGTNSCLCLPFQIRKIPVAKSYIQNSSRPGLPKAAERRSRSRMDIKDEKKQVLAEL